MPNFGEMFRYDSPLKFVMGFLTAFITLFFCSLSVADTSPTSHHEIAMQPSHVLPLTETQKPSPVCVYIASYATDYVWQQGIDHGLLPILSKACQVHTFYMDTKNQKGEAYRVERGKLAKAFIEKYQPDLVVVSDDNAVKYVLAPYFKNSSIPFVFCGVNDTGSVYGLPYRNTTGIIEKTEYYALLEYAFRLSLGKRKMGYLSADETTAKKNESAFVLMAEQRGLPYEIHNVKTLKAWKEAFLSMQNNPAIDFIVLGNFTSLPGKKDQGLEDWVREHTSKVVASIYSWMMPYAVFGVIKLPEEQGRWAGKAAVAILHGYAPSDIPIVPNRRYQLMLNPKNIKHLKLNLPASFSQQALEVSD